MNGLVIYRSKYGATKRYAEWISERTGLVLKDIVDVRQKDVLQAENVVIGFGVYANGLPGIGFLQKHSKDLIGKRVFVYACGASPYDEKALAVLKSRTLTGELEPLPLFYVRGAFNLRAMSFMDRNLCKLLIRTVRKKDPSEMEVWEKALLEAEDTPADWTSPDQLEPLLEAIGTE